MAVASGSCRDVLHQTLAHLGIASWFQAIISSEDTERHKPEPDVFLRAAESIGVSPAHCLVYEDTDIGLQAASAAGMQSFDVRAVHSPTRVES